jgi:hypothetical protein
MTASRWTKSLDYQRKDHKHKFSFSTGQLSKGKPSYQASKKNTLFQKDLVSELKFVQTGHHWKPPSTVSFPLQFSAWVSPSALIDWYPWRNMKICDPSQVKVQRNEKWRL